MYLQKIMSVHCRSEDAQNFANSTRYPMLLERRVNFLQFLFLKISQKRFKNQMMSKMYLKLLNHFNFCLIKKKIDLIFKRKVPNSNPALHHQIILGNHTSQSISYLISSNWIEHFGFACNERWLLIVIFIFFKNDENLMFSTKS